MKKRILCLAMTAMMVLGMPMTANAEHFEGSKDWKVTFTGDEMESNFKSSDAANEVLSNLQPGDSIDLQITIENGSGRKTDWYMTNEVIKTLEDSNNSAQGGAYTYVLTYVAPDGAAHVIYNSDVVGGEKISRNIAEEGLHEATSTLEDYFFLDRLDEGKSALVKLFVGLDGETQGNAYQDTLAKLQMNFAVERVSPKIKTQDKEEIVEREIIKSVKTGDTAPIIMFSVLTLVSGLFLMVIAVKQTRSSREEEQ